MKQLINPKTDLYEELKSYILSHHFPWYYIDSGVVDETQTLKTDSVVPFMDTGRYDNPPLVSHTFLSRPTSKVPYSHPTCSKLVEVDEEFKEIFSHNKVDINCFYRINANLVHPPFPGGRTETFPHVDHSFPHNNILIYLPGAGGKTICGKYKHDPQEDDIITFTGKHYHQLPHKEKRVVLVATYI